MKSPEAKVPSQGISAGTGTQKHISDLIGSNASIKWSGTNGTASGDVKYVSDFSEFFDTKESSGHFFPISIDKKYQNKKLTASGRTGGDKQITIDQDLMLIQRIENLEGAKKLTVKDGGSTIFTIDFNEATLKPPVGKDAIILPDQSKSFGKYGDTKSYLDAGVKIDWTGTTGTVKGKLLHATNTEVFHGDLQSGHYYPLVLSDYYKGKTVSVNGEEKHDHEIIVCMNKIRLGTNKIVVTYNGETIATLDFSQVEYGEEA